MEGKHVHVWEASVYAGMGQVMRGMYLSGASRHAMDRNLLEEQRGAGARKIPIYTGRCVFDLSLSAAPPAPSGLLGPLDKKQKQNSTHFIL
jgi:hypothetical protein